MFTFTADHLATIKTMHGAGKSTKQIATALHQPYARVYAKMYTMKQRGELSTATFTNDNGHSTDAVHITGPVNDDLTILVAQIAMLKSMTPAARIAAIKLII